MIRPSNVWLFCLLSLAGLGRVGAAGVDPAIASYVAKPVAPVSAAAYVNAEGAIRIVTNRKETGDMTEYRFKEHEKRVDNHIPSSDPILFYEVETGDVFWGVRDLRAGRRRNRRIWCG